MRRRLASLLLAFAALAVVPAAASAATYSVNAAADTPVGQACPGLTGCSLRQAITSANASAGADTILVPAGTYALAYGVLPVTEALTVSGTGAGRPVIDGQNASGLFESDFTVALTLRDLELTRGFSSIGRGAAVSHGGAPLVLDDVHVHHNVSETTSGATASGGAIYTNGNVTLTDSVIEHNRATATLGNAVGGALGSYGLAPQVSITRTTFRENVAEGLDGVSAGAARTGGPATIVDSTFERNTARITGSSGHAQGGAIVAYNGTLLLRGSTVRQNVANGGTGTAAGGGLVRALGNGLATGAATIEESRISDNMALGSTATGGGVATDAIAMTLRRSTVDNNEATAGAVNGVARGGGAGAYGGGTLTLDTVTVTGNEAAAGPMGLARGGGLWIADADGSSAAAVTISENATTTTGGTARGGGVAGDVAARAFTVQGSVLSGNTQTDATADCDTLTLTSTGGNVVNQVGGASACAFTPHATDAVTGDPQLRPFGNYGNSVPVMPPETAGSVVLDRYTGCGGYDVRGFSRPQGASCDAGAFEAVPGTLWTGKLTQGFGTVTVGQASTTSTWTIHNEGDLDATPNLSLTGDGDQFTTSGCTAVVAPEATCTLTVGFAPTSPGAKSATIAGLSVTVALSGTALPEVPACTSTTAQAAYESAVDVALACTWSPTARTIVDAPDHGTLGTVGATVRYTPGPGFVGTDTFTFTGTNAAGTSPPATVTVTVLPPPTPVCVDGAATTAFGAAVAVPLACTGVLTGWELVTAPAHGTLGTLGASVTYTPNAGWSGEDAFTFRAVGPGGLSNVARATVTVAAPLPLPEPPAPPAPRTEPTPPPAPVPPACTGRALSLLELTVRGSRIAVRGMAQRTGAGQRVTLLSGERVLGTAVTGADGLFAATVRRPAGSGTVRIVAAADGQRSLPFAVERRTTITSRRVSGGRVTVRAVVRGAREGAVVAIERQVGCGAPVPFGAARVGQGGRLTLSLPLPPAGEPLALYRAITTIPGTQAFSLPLAVTAKG